MPLMAIRMGWQTMTLALTALLAPVRPGIGKVTAFSLAKHGVKKFGLGEIHLNTIEATASKLSKQFPELEVHAMQLEVASEKSIDDVIASITQKFGTIDYVVNNAGVAGSLVLSAERSLADWRSVMNVNSDGVWMSQRAEIRQMLKQKAGDLYRTSKGVIINVSSMYGLIGTSMNILAIAYTTSKHAVVGMTRGDAIAYAREGIRINSINPGYVETPLSEASAASDVMARERE